MVEVGRKVEALIYNRDQTWMPAIIVGETSPEDVKRGYRYGIIVQIHDGSKHWVRQDHIKYDMEEGNE